MKKDYMSEIPPENMHLPAPVGTKSRGDVAGYIELGQNAFNYSVHGRRGFHLLADVMQRCACFNLRYSNLDEAIATFGALEVPGAA